MLACFGSYTGVDVQTEVSMASQLLRSWNRLGRKTLIGMLLRVGSFVVDLASLDWVYQASIRIRRALQLDFEYSDLLTLLMFAYSSFAVRVVLNIL